MSKRKLHCFIAAVLIALLLGSTAWATPKSWPPKCSACSQDPSCATEVGGGSINPQDGKPDVTISLPGAGGWTPSFTYYGAYEPFDLGAGWQHSEEIWIDYTNGNTQLTLWVNAFRGVIFERAAIGNPWVAHSSGTGSNTLQIPWSVVTTSDVTAGDVQVAYSAGDAYIQYVFYGMNGAATEGRLKSKTANGITVTCDAYTGAKVEKVIDGLGRTITYVYNSNGLLTKIIEPGPADLDNTNGRITYLEYVRIPVVTGSYYLQKINVGMQKPDTEHPGDPDEGSGGDDPPASGDYYWRTYLLGYEVYDGIYIYINLAAVLYPDGYAKAKEVLGARNPAITPEEATLTDLKDYATIYYDYEDTDWPKVIEESSLGAGCSGCGGGQGYTYLASGLSDLDPTNGNTFNSGRNAAAYEVRITRPANGNVAEILQINTEGQAVARWFDLGEDKMQRLERRTYTSSGLLEKMYTYDVTDQLDPANSDYTIADTITAAHVEYWTYDDMSGNDRPLLFQKSVSADDTTFVLVKKYQYNREKGSPPTDFRKYLLWKESDYPDPAHPETPQTTAYVYDDCGRVAMIVHPTITTNTTSMADAIPLERFLYYPDGRLQSHTDAEGITTTYQYADNDGLDNDADNLIDELDENDRPDGSEGFALTREFRSDQADGLHLETRHAYSTDTGVWRRVSTTVYPGGNASARTTEFAYTGDGGAWGNVTAITSQSGFDSPTAYVSKRFAYDATDRITSDTSYDADGTTELSQAGYIYNKFGQTVEVRNALPTTGFTTVNKYDTSGRLSEVWERVKDYTSSSDLVDQDGDPLYEILGNVTFYTYVGQTNLVKEVKRRAGRMNTSYTPVTVATYTYDFMGRLKTITDGENNVTTNSYDYRGRLETVVDPLSDYTVYVYDNLDRRTEVKRHKEYGESDILMAWEKSAFDEAGRVYQSVNQNPDNSAGISIDYYYDEAGKLRKTVGPKGSGTGNTTEYFYDPAGRLYRTTDMAGNETLYRLNGVGEIERILRKQDLGSSYRNELTFQYHDVEGRLRYVSFWGTNGGSLLICEDPHSWNCEGYPDDPYLQSSPQTTSTKLVTETTYDGLGRVTQIIDPAGAVTTRSYDGLSRTTSIAEDTGTIDRVTDFSYDQEISAGGPWCDQVIARNGTYDDQTTKYYREDDPDATRVTSVIYPDSGTVAFAYYNDGALDTRTDQRQWKTTYTRDGLRRVTQEDVEALDSPPLEGTSQVTYTYDALGRLLSVVDNNGTAADASVDYTYSWPSSTSDRVTTETQEVVSGFSYATETLTNALGRRTYLKYSTAQGALQLDYTYDDLNRVTAVRNHAGQSAFINYTYLGDYLASKSFVNGGIAFNWGSTTDLTYHYDSFGRPTLCHYWGTNLGDCVKLRYDYDSASNVTWRYDECMQSQYEPKAWSQKYTYDTLHRLATASEGSISNWGTTPTMPNPVKTWTWDDLQANGPELDKLGNWVNFNNNGTTETRTHDTANEITVRNIGSSRIITYDAADNLSTIQNETDDGGSRYAYDYRNRLITVEHTDDITEVNPDDVVWENVATYLYDGLNRRVKKDLDTGTDTLYIYNGWQCIEERNAASGDLLRQYVYGAQYIDEVVCKIESDGGKLFYLHDCNYNVVALTNTSAAVQERYNYEPYGALTIADASYGSRSATTQNNALTFQGQRYDSESGLYYFRNRYYSPTLGRFLQRDPAGYENGLNLYENVSNSPISHLDPLGERIYVYDIDNAAFAAAVLKGFQDIIGDCANLYYTSTEFRSFFWGSPLTIVGGGMLIPYIAYNGQNAKCLCDKCWQQLKKVIDSNTIEIGIHRGEANKPKTVTEGGANPTRVGVQVNENVNVEAQERRAVPEKYTKRRAPFSVVLWHEVVGHAGNVLENQRHDQERAIEYENVARECLRFRGAKDIDDRVVTDEDRMGDRMRARWKGIPDDE